MNDLRWKYGAVALMLLAPTVYFVVTFVRRGLEPIGVGIAVMLVLGWLGFLLLLRRSTAPATASKALLMCSAIVLIAMVFYIVLNSSSHATV